MNILQFLKNGGPKRVGPLVLFLWLLPLFAASPPYAAESCPGGICLFRPKCHVDGDDDIDRNDIQLILSARNQPASGPGDPRDADGDSKITVKDARACTLSCTLSRCQVPPVTISSNVIPMGGGSVNGAGNYTQGSTVTLTATPNQGFMFINWSINGNEVSTDPTYTFTANANQTVVAAFVPDGSPYGEATPYRKEAFLSFYGGVPGRSRLEDKPAGWHPLLRKRTTTLRSEELLVLNINAGGFIEDDKEGGKFPNSLPPMGGAPATSYRATGHANVDGVGGEELIILRDRAGDGLVLEVYGVSLDSLPVLKKIIPVATIGGDDMWVERGRLTAGDLDGDGADEVIVYGFCVDHNNISHGCAAAYHWDGRSEMILPSASVLHRSWAEDMKGIAVAVADFDKDNKPELFLLGHSSSENPVWGAGNPVWGAILGWNATAERFDVLAANAQLASGILDDGNYAIEEIGAVAADIDGDGQPEAVAAAIRRDNYGGGREIFMQVLDFQIPPKGTLTVKTTIRRSGLQAAQSPYDDELWLLARADLNFDGRDEIVSTLRDWDSYGINQACRLDMFAFNDALPEGAFQFDNPNVTIFEGDSTTTHKSRCAMAILDNDRDGADEVILGRLDPVDGNDIKFNPLSRREIHVDFQCAAYQENSSGLSECVQGAYVVKSTPLPVETMQYGYLTPPPLAFLGADFDGDDLTLKYTGNKELTVSEPRILFVAAAPPTQAGISQNYTLTGTTIEVSRWVSGGVGRGYGTSSSLTVSAGTPGVLDEVIFGIGSASASETLARILEESHTTMRIAKWTQAFAGDSENDMVVFQATEQESYEYEIVAATKDPDRIGEHIYFNVPSKIHIYKWSLKKFNESVTDPSDEIHIFRHTPGDVSSYMSESDKAAIADRYGTQRRGRFLDIGDARVGMGGGFIALSLELSMEEASEFELTQNIEYAGEFEILGLGGGGSDGISRSAVYTVSVGNSTVYEGAVGDIANKQWEQYRYTYGMFLRWIKDRKGRRYQVIDYWVDDLGPGYQ